MPFVHCSLLHNCKGCYKWQEKLELPVKSAIFIEMVWQETEHFVKGQNFLSQKFLVSMKLLICRWNLMDTCIILASSPFLFQWFHFSSIFRSDTNEHRFSSRIKQLKRYHSVLQFQPSLERHLSLCLLKARLCEGFNYSEDQRHSVPTVKV